MQVSLIIGKRNPIKKIIVRKIDNLLGRKISFSIQSAFQSFQLRLELCDSFLHAVKTFSPCTYDSA